ncbi:MAG: DUF4139 domain-containing protein, partial [Lewinella sp.]|nr:DUF4139 domain-containing protein [Lewinella sp.]
DYSRKTKKLKPIPMIQRYLLLLCFLSISLAAYNQDIQKDFSTTSISIFKNATAFFIKSGTVKTENERYRITKNVPPALFGTYWMNTAGGEISSLTSYLDTLETTKQLPTGAIPEIIQANLGQQLILYLDGGEIVQGTVEAVEKGDLLSHQIITFHMNDRWKVIKISDIKRIDFLERPKGVYEQKEKEVKPVLEVQFASDKKEQQVDLMYLAKGLSWTPLYLMELTGEKQARLTLRAEVVNNIEDIEGTDVHFVVGVPNFSYADQLSPLVSIMPSPYAAAYNAPTNYDMFSNTIQSQVRGGVSYAIEDNSIPASSATISGLEGSAEEDLYFYTLKDLSLKKGGRGHYPVFTANVGIAHIYECNLPQNYAEKYAYGKSYLFSPDPHKVFHSVKVVNDTEYPFTTGPILVVKTENGAKPISQDRLNYTPVKGNSFIKLTEAPDVDIKQAEKAEKREENVKMTTRNQNTYYYDRITVSGQVKVKNYKSQKVDLNIRRTITGELLESSVKWLQSERVNTSGDLNKQTDVCWETSVDAGKELTINYSYQIYVPH